MHGGVSERETVAAFVLGVMFLAFGLFFVYAVRKTGPRVFVYERGLVAGRLAGAGASIATRKVANVAVFLTLVEEILSGRGPSEDVVIRSRASGHPVRDLVVPAPSRP